MVAQGEWCRQSLGLSYGQALGVIAAALCLEAATLAAADRRRWRPGRARLAAVAPFAALNVLVPVMFCRRADVITIILTSFNTSWLTSFKALAWALNRGPLSERRLTGVQFGAILLTPLTPVQSPRGGNGKSKARLGDSAGGPLKLLGAWLAKLVLICVVVFSLQHDLPTLLKSFAMTMGLYGLLSAIMDGPAALVTSSIGIKVSPHFDQPWLSNSVAALWSKRWDLAAGNALRALIFEPICEGRAVGRPQPAAAAAAKQAEGAAVPPRRAVTVRDVLAVVATFATSGLVHEFIFWCMLGHTSGGVWLSFFLVQVPLQLAERELLRVLKKRGVLPPNPLRIACTLLLEVWLVWHLFWRPVEEQGIKDDVVNNVIATLDAGARLLGLAA